VIIRCELWQRGTGLTLAEKSSPPGRMIVKAILM